jgi:hypothetical protein
VVVAVDAPGNAGCSQRGTCLEGAGAEAVPAPLAVVTTFAGWGEADCLEATAVAAAPGVLAAGVV